MNLLRRRVRPVGPLHVLFVVPDLNVGGAERHVATLTPALDPARAVASVVTIGDEGTLFPGLVDAGVPAVALHSRRNPAAALVRLVRLMQQTRPDVVVTRGYNSEALGRIAAVLTRVPRTVVWVHNNGDIEPRGRIRRAVDRLLEPVTSAYYAVAHGQRPYLTGDLDYPDDKIHVIYNGVDPDRFSVRTGDDYPELRAELGLPAGPVIGVVAVLRPEKDHETMLRAMRLVLDEVPDAQLLLVGDGPMRARLQECARDLRIDRSVVFAGSRSDVGRLLAILDVAALSSTTVECFPMALLEAMASGVPTVATALGGVPEMIDEGVTGHVVLPRDAPALASALVAMVRDREHAAAMGRAARTRVESCFSLERSARAAESALEKTAGRAVVRPVRLVLVLDLTFVGGAEMLLLTLFRNLDRSRVRPRLVCLREGGPLADEFRAAGVPVDVLERSGRYDLTTLPRLVRLLRADRTDVVLVTHHHRAALTLGRIAARAARVPANVVAAHDMDLTNVGGRVLPRHVVDTLFLSQALVLLAPSQGDYLHRCEGVGRYPWRRVREVVIPNGIVLPPASTAADRTDARRLLGLDPDATVVGIVARLSPQKAHAVLLHAVASLAPSRPELRLVVVGEGTEEARLRALVNQLGLTGRVLFTGVRRDVPVLLPAFDVACLSSVHEGAPMAVLESMAAALPMVTTDCGALREMISDGEEGYVVPVGDTGAFAACLGKLIDDPELRSEMGRRARRRAEREYAIHHTAAGYQRLLTELTAR